MVKPLRERLPVPRSIVGAVADSETLRALPSLDAAQRCDYLEFRVDALPELLDSAQGLRVQRKIPVLLTVRREDEGGCAALSDARRLALYERFLPSASLVDLEIRSLRSLQRVVDLATAASVPVVASFHDFRSTPSRRALRDRIRQAADRGASVVKLATRVGSAADLARLAGLLENPVSPMPLSAMGMGPLGAASRVLLAQLGSVLNYGFLLRPNAPGQWPVTLLRQVFSALPAPSPSRSPE